MAYPGKAPSRSDGALSTLPLLMYLAMEAAHAQSRESLAALLWPEQPGETARHSLGQTLLYLRHAVQDDR